MALGLGLGSSFLTANGGWTPAVLGSSLLGWWDAERADKLTLSGSSVITWTDIVAGYAPTQGTSGARPRYNAKAFNGTLNLLLQNRALTNAAWIKRGTGSVTTDGAVTRPDGTLGAQLVVVNSGTNDVYQSVGALVTAARYEPSLALKKVSASGTIAMQNPSDASKGTWLINLALVGSGWETITRSHAAVTISSEFTANSGSAGMLFNASAGGPLSFYVDDTMLQSGTASTAPVETGASATYGFGRPGLILDGSDDQLTLASVPFPTGSNPSRIWVLFDQTEPAEDTADRVIFSYGGVATSDSRFVYRSYPSAQRFRAAASNVTAGDVAISFRGAHACRGSFTATTNAAAVDGTSGTASAVTQATGTTRTRIGSNTANTAAVFGKGVINTILVDDGSAAAIAQDANILQFLNARRGV